MVLTLNPQPAVTRDLPIAPGDEDARMVCRADLAFLRHRGLTEWLVGEQVNTQPQPCTLETNPHLATLSTAITSELAALTGLGLTDFFLHQHVGRVYAIALLSSTRVSGTPDVWKARWSRARPKTHDSETGASNREPSPIPFAAHPALPWLVGVPAACLDVLAHQRALATNVGTVIRQHGDWPGSATPAALRALALSGCGLGLTRAELAYWLLLLQLLEGHYAQQLRPLSVLYRRMLPANAG